MVNAKEKEGARLSEFENRTATLLTPFEAVNWLAENSESPVVADCSAHDDPSTYVSLAYSLTLSI